MLYREYFASRVSCSTNYIGDEEIFIPFRIYVYDDTNRVLRERAICFYTRAQRYLSNKRNVDWSKNKTTSVCICGTFATDVPPKHFIKSSGKYEIVYKLPTTVDEKYTANLMIYRKLNEVEIWNRMFEIYFFYIYFGPVFFFTSKKRVIYSCSLFSNL